MKILFKQNGHQKDVIYIGIEGDYLKVIDIEQNELIYSLGDVSVITDDSLLRNDRRDVVLCRECKFRNRENYCSKYKKIKKPYQYCSEGELKNEN